MKNVGRDRKRRTSKGPWVQWTSALMVGLVLGAPLALGGCDDDDDVGFQDLIPPAIPNGVYSITADQTIFLRWNPNREADLAGYHILSNTDGGSEYFIIATIDAEDPDFYFDGGTSDPADDYLEYPDYDVVNGEYYWYAVAAFDDQGNESALSLETVVDVPRPEGLDLFLTDRIGAPATAGVDFSSLRPGVDEDPQPWNDPSTDIYFEIDGNGDRWLVAAPQGVDIQDYGYVGFDVATWAPTRGWSAAGRTEAIVGHTYIFRIAEPGAQAGDFHYAKAEILDMPQSTVELWWGYQSITNERELKAAQRNSGPSRSK